MLVLSSQKTVYTSWPYKKKVQLHPQIENKGLHEHCDIAPGFSDDFKKSCISYFINQISAHFLCPYFILSGLISKYRGR